MSEDCHESPEPQRPYQPLPDASKDETISVGDGNRIIVVMEYTDKASPAYRGTRFIQSFPSEEEFDQVRTIMEANPNRLTKIYSDHVSRDEAGKMCDESITLDKIIEISQYEGDGDPIIAMMHAENMMASKFLTGQQRLHILARLT